MSSQWSYQTDQYLPLLQRTTIIGPKEKKNEDVLFVEEGNEISANIINHREQKKSIREHKH